MFVTMLLICVFIFTLQFGPELHIFLMWTLTEYQRIILNGQKVDVLVVDWKELHWISVWCWIPRRKIAISCLPRNSIPLYHNTHPNLTKLVHSLVTRCNARYSNESSATSSYKFGFIWHLIGKKIAF